MMEQLGAVAGIDGRQLEDSSNTALINKLKEALPEALEKLTDRQREVVIMYFWHNLTQQEIADELGITQKVVAVHLKRSLRKLGKILANRV